jgi:hypothetical protein
MHSAQAMADALEMVDPEAALTRDGVPEPGDRVWQSTLPERGWAVLAEHRHVQTELLEPQCQCHTGDAGAHNRDAGGCHVISPVGLCAVGLWVVRAVEHLQLDAVRILERQH